MLKRDVVGNLVGSTTLDMDGHNWLVSRTRTPTADPRASDLHDPSRLCKARGIASGTFRPYGGCFRTMPESRQDEARTKADVGS
jgi:hypothetical protein